MSTKHSQTLRRRQVDRQMRNLSVSQLTVPRRGWIAEVRGLLGIRLGQLARRVGVSTPTVKRFEQAEADGSITLHSLHKVAAAMDCRLVYVLVPRSTFEETLQDRARLVARQMVETVGHTMALEDQSLTADQQQAMIDDLAGELVRTLPSQLWN